MYIEALYNSADLVIWCLSGALIIAMLIQLYYYLFIFSNIARYTDPEDKAIVHGISVIICAKNEAENLRNNLPGFLQQDHPEYEVVVVNDCSTDETEEVLMDLKVKYPHLRYTTIPLDNKFRHGKKLAVTVGIKAAKYDHLLFSDADCYPATDKWISKMTSNFSGSTELILGVGKYERKKGILNNIVRYETFFTAMQYLSFAKRGKAFMGVGRNLSYKKELFYRHKGFASHLKVLSGDDDLFVNEASTKNNTTIELSSDSFTISEPPLTFGGWFKQKKRHLSTGKYYKSSSKIRLGTEYFSRMIFYAAAISLLFFDYWFWISIGAYLLLSAIKLIVIKLNMKKLQEQDLLVSSLMLDFFIPPTLLFVRISNIIRPREPKWS